MLNVDARICSALRKWYNQVLGGLEYEIFAHVLAGYDVKQLHVVQVDRFRCKWLALESDLGTPLGAIYPLEPTWKMRLEDEPMTEPGAAELVGGYGLSPIQKAFKSIAIGTAINNYHQQQFIRTVDGPLDVTQLNKPSG